MVASRSCFTAFAFLCTLAAGARADVRMPRIFSSGVVLQRETRVRIFGFATPGEEVRVHSSFGVSSDVAWTDGEGGWSTTLDTPAAGGPYTLEVRGKNVVRIDDVWIGEVWLASGQSNMEMPVGPFERSWSGALDWQKEIAGASDARLRLFTVENRIAPVACDDVGGSWTAATPEEVTRFSATAWFFARRLRADLDVPIGIVAADWSGTPIEAWTSGISLARDPEFTDTITRLESEARAPAKAARSAARTTEAWLAAVEEVDHGLRDGCASASPGATGWRDVTVPGELGGEFAGHDGIFWLRCEFDLEASLADRDAQLHLPPVDDFDAVFLDGALVGATLIRSQSRSPRAYAVPRAMMKAGRHVLAVRVLDVAGSGGILGDPAGLHLSVDGHDLALAGQWKARAGAKMSLIPSRPADVDFGPHTPSALYNGMIAPLVRFTFRGAIWYQGESNRKRASRYTTLFPGLIEDWRARFGNATWPFYFVQVAPYDYEGDVGEAAELREAQRRALNLQATGMAATADLGEARDIHPRRKREVGERLALWALSGTYGRDVECSGPLVDEAHSGARPLGEFVVRFDHARGLRFTGDSGGVFELADDHSNWVGADARIEGTDVVLRADACPHPTAARLDTRASLPARLVNESGLPAAAFRIGSKPWITAQAPRRGRWSRNGDVVTIAPPTARALDGLPIGNGSTGAFVWVDGSSLKLTLGRADRWDLRRPAVTLGAEWNARDLAAAVAAGDEARIHERYDDPYERFDHPSRLPLAELEIPLGGRKPRAFGIDLVRAEAQVPLSNGLVHAIASAARPIVALRIEDADFERLVPASWRLTTVDGATSGGANGLTAESVAPDGSSIGIAVRATAREGGLEIVIACADGAEDAAPSEAAAERAESALQIGYARLMGEHILAFRAASGTASVSLGDPALQNHYDFARYLAVSASRRGAPPAALQGPWNVGMGPPPWHGDYHNDLNSQATHAPFSTAGLFDSAQSFFDFHTRLLPRFGEFARDFHGVRGAVVPGVMALDGSPMGGWAQYALSPTNGAWTSALFARHWRVTRDATFLETQAAPFCLQIATALEALAPVGSDGKRRLALSSSPEFKDNSLGAWLAPNSNYDLALLRSAFGDASAIERALGHPDESARWERALLELPEFDLDENGALTIARGEPYRASHRHFSHALAIQPLGLISIEGGARERRIVDATVDGILAHGTRQWVGYSFAWFSALAARAGRPEIARRYLLDYERAFTLANGLHVNGDRSGEGLSDFTYDPFTLEGNMLAMEAVHEMLLQSFGGTVRVFPAVSRVWSDVSFEDLHAEGGFVVSARRVDGATRRVVVRSEHAGRLRLRDPFGGGAVNWNRSGVERDGGDYLVAMDQGEVLIGTLGGSR